MRGRLKTQCKSSRKRHCKTSSAARQADPSRPKTLKRAKVGALVFAEELAINSVKSSGTYFFKNFSFDELRLIFRRIRCQEVEYIFFQKMIGNAFRIKTTEALRKSFEEKKICFMRLNFILRRYHFLPRFVDKFLRRRLRISVCEKRFFERNAVDVKKCIFAYFCVDKQGIVWISMWISASKTAFGAVCAYSALIAGRRRLRVFFISK